MKTIEYLGPKKLVLKNRPKPKPKANEILMQTKSVGICGTDLHIYNGGMNLPTPLVPGHEFSGIISAIGSQVSKNFKIGDRITAEHVIPCNKCNYCKQGKPNLCINAKIIGLHRPGALAEYVAIPADLVYKVPNKISFEEAALLEPLTIALYAIHETTQLLNIKAAVIGQGPIGILLDQVLKASGAYVVGFDILQSRLQWVKNKKWADEVIDSKKSNELKKFANSFDVVFEVVGRQITAQTSIDIARRDGQVFLLGVFEEPSKLDLMKIVKKELNVHGSWTCAFSFPQAIDLVMQNKIDLKSLITHRYSIDQAAQAFKDASAYSNDRIKTVINF
ncbi:MAG: alcohol dehydrogenase catalytic domain-containing protein [Patescibacteria group bacterium]|nr:alcohol dehydrogenase catalytic domain-containing protein [Patescibacteria group bacterium]MBU1160512.1 alcohol dehydrogenase catalytic domain-containing protein [Patescibacteria group bacterium]MBU1684164.1 alcohol dehydrogenase catalytic domain-containing protein [Patescibacteria group bacterium]MBU1987709.1 alcohol dehydrogenase catalytic domain-containing protein [Patescibacteria group bacterium]